MIKQQKEQESGTTFYHSVHKELEALCSDGSYFNTWATVFGPNQDPTDFPSETPIEAVKKKHIMLNNVCKYVNIIITKLNKTFRLLTFFNLTMTDIYMQKNVLFFKEVHKNNSYDLAITHIKYTVCIYTSVFVLITVSE